MKIEELYKCLSFDINYGCRCIESEHYGRYPSVGSCNSCEYKVTNDEADEQVKVLEVSVL